MKQLKRALLSLSLVAICAFAAPKSKVYICVSPRAYAYHETKACKCLNRCTHEIREVTLEEAKKAGKDKPCGCCIK